MTLRELIISSGNVVPYAHCLAEFEICKTVEDICRMKLFRYMGGVYFQYDMYEAKQDMEQYIKRGYKEFKILIRPCTYAQIDKDLQLVLVPLDIIP